MKLSRNLTALILMIVIVVNFSILGVVETLAHETMLNVEYDGCDDHSLVDWIDESWYVLYTRRETNENSKCYHISHETQTIKYYFADESPTGYRWDTDISEELAEEIKTFYALSMEKWNNVYFYSYDTNGNIVKNKVINIVEGTSTDNNLVICPFYENSTTFAETIYYEENKENIETFVDEKIEHNHISEWYMNVNLYNFYLHGNVSEDIVNNARNRTGAHEIGHILGLRDLDSFSLCGAGTPDEHHEELLMGYGNIAYRTSDITYKDLAGVAITRGFHTDSDHKWLYAGQQSDGTYKLICSICNGVKYVESLSGYTYNTYNACGENHALSSGNMMAVASYGTTDYYKCKYCRYVAPFSSNVPQNYTVASCSNEQHKYTNNVDGLEYRFYEDHNIEYTDIGTSCHTCSCACGYTITNQAHSFRCEKESSSYHRKICDCGYTQLSIHHLVRKSVKYSICMDCGYVQYHNGEIIEVPGIESVEGEEELPL